MDQFIVKTPGRLPTGYGREGHESRYHGQTIFNDAVCGAIWVENQVSLGARETKEAKLHFKQWLREPAWIEVQHYQSDNGVFIAEEFVEQCKSQNQKQSSLVLGPST